MIREQEERKRKRSVPSVCMYAGRSRRRGHWAGEH